MIRCNDIRCKYRNEKGKCIAKNLTLGFHSVATVNMGQKHFLECKTFEKSKEYKDMEKKIGFLLEDSDK